MPQQPPIDYDKLAAEVHGATPAPPEAKPVSTGGGRGTGLDVRKSNRWASDNAPAIGATLATTATGGGALPLILASMGGGTAGAALRGDDPVSALYEGGKQGLLQGTGMGLVKAGGAVARGLMKGTVPKNIGKEFDQVDIPQEMLNRGAFPGVPASRRRIEGLSRTANTERDAAATTVPAMSRHKVIEGLKPIYQKGVKGKVPEMSEDALEAMRKSSREIGPEGLDGPAALARKDIKQAQGNAALTSSDSRTAAFGSQLADAERGAIVSHLRETPRMGTALNESQTMMAIDKVMQDASHSNPVTRARIGGLTAASMSPVGLGATAHAVNQGRRAFDPQTLRLLDMLFGQRSGQ